MGWLSWACNHLTPILVVAVGTVNTSFFVFLEYIFFKLLNYFLLCKINYKTVVLNSYIDFFLKKFQYLSPLSFTSSSLLRYLFFFLIGTTMSLSAPVSSSFSMGGSIHNQRRPCSAADPSPPWPSSLSSTTSYHCRCSGHHQPSSPSLLPFPHHHQPHRRCCGLSLQPSLNPMSSSPSSLSLWDPVTPAYLTSLQRRCSVEGTDMAVAVLDNAMSGFRRGFSTPSPIPHMANRQQLGARTVDPAAWGGGSSDGSGCNRRIQRRSRAQQWICGTFSLENHIFLAARHRICDFLFCDQKSFFLTISVT